MRGRSVFHRYRDCSADGKQFGAGMAAVCCMPLDGFDPKQLSALAMCHVFQCAVDEGASAFTQACAAYGAPVALNSAGDISAIDVFAYGFTMGGTSGEEDAFGDNSTRMHRRVSKWCCERWGFAAGGAAVHPVLPKDSVCHAALAVGDGDMAQAEPVVLTVPTREERQPRVHPDIHGRVPGRRHRDWGALPHSCAVDGDDSGYDTDDCNLDSAELSPVAARHATDWLRLPARWLWLWPARHSKQ
ncbi:hypothetical protein CYMTET_55487 [Cymbomonas tetramitiformis]|uniref:Uncharacterized protein n=1 Tax=Cymbomonas tetramitiformis TaxID=36881 RepID=A0AAE0EMS2_9CHLO|nr:hypothetical protein CYMTET_55487 [Cymbomonas tetramitiformis]